MEQAIGLGLTMVKFFPAEPAGGLKAIRAIAAPYTMMKFMPTGGINPQNVKRIPGIRPHRSMRRKLDGKKYDD